LLLTQSVLLVVLIKALLPPDPPLLRVGRSVSLPLLRGATSGLRQRPRRVRSGGMDSHRLWAEIGRTNKKCETRTKKGRENCAHRPGVGEHHE
jgi:hypothetical protein